MRNFKRCVQSASLGKTQGEQRYVIGSGFDH
jgi:hypothetical protein